MSEQDTMPIDFNAKLQVLWQEVQRISEQNAARVSAELDS